MQQDKQFSDTDGAYRSIDYTFFLLLLPCLKVFKNRNVFCLQMSFLSLNFKILKK